MEEPRLDLESRVSLQGLLGYLNFSAGRPDVRFQRQLSEAYGYLSEKGVTDTWPALFQQLRDKLHRLAADHVAGFQETGQAESVLSLVFERLLPAYRRHHADLLFHQSDSALFQPFFVARACEAVLLQGPPWHEGDRIVAEALRRLNDFVGHRPIAILETRDRAEPYDHERVRPIPLFIRGAGAAWGRYSRLVEKTLEILGTTSPDILRDAYLDLSLLDELALDPRAYDFTHPVNRRPNYVFGEWDPHHLDGQGRYRRYVARQITLDALLDRVEHASGIAPEDALVEAAAVLAGTMLMATGISGAGPETHDSGTTLAKLMPGVARYRDAFYAELLGRLSESHRDRLLQEQSDTRQPFGGARQHLNQYLARQRAFMLQNRHLAVLHAVMGYPEASRKCAALIPAASSRLMSEIHIRLAAGQILVDRGELTGAVPLTEEVEDLLHRGIACGALPDPWNILGFQGQFALFAALEDSVRDHRIDELLHVVDRLFALLARIMSEAASRGELALIAMAQKELSRIAAWWDRFASIEVGGIRRVHGEEASASAANVAEALALWHERGQAGADVAFWRDQLQGFRSPKAFALVIDTLLRKRDFLAAMALLINWLSQVEQVPFEEGEFSFHTLALRWMLGVGALTSDADAWSLKRKMLDYLEANAEDFWQVPSLSSRSLQESTELGQPAEEEDDVYGAAYEHVTYRDSTADGVEGEVLEGGSSQEFNLEAEGETLLERLRFLATVARLWQVGSWRRPDSTPGPLPDERLDVVRPWLANARKNRQALLPLMDSLHDYPVPEPSGDHDSLVEYDRHQLMKAQLLAAAIGTCLDTTMAMAILRGLLDEDSLAAASSNIPGLPAWDRAALSLERAILKGDASAARTRFADLISKLRGEPLLYRPLEHGGHPRHIMEVSLTQNIVRVLANTLPRLGLFRETYELLQVARAMEQAPLQEQGGPGRRISVFDQLFQTALQAVIQTLAESAETWTDHPQGGQHLGDLLDGIVEPFVSLWEEHSQTLQLSVLDSVRGETEWSAIRAFIQNYGSDLFHARFMTLANLRGILHRGVGAYLDYLAANPDPLHPVRLIDDLDRAIPRANAERYMTWIIAAVIESYEEYKDYNSSTPQSDYGENLHKLLDFLVLKAGYDRQAWLLRPIILVHEVLVRQGQWETAALWQAEITRLTEAAAESRLQELARLEQAHGIRLRTVADRLGEKLVKPLALDRLCALIGPAMEEARDRKEPAAFARFERELQPYAREPVGVGLDVPSWLRRLEAEVERVQIARSEVAGLAEQLIHVPRLAMSRDQIEQQIREWKKPKEDS